ncbi:hypothetical protein NM688_g8443 [Phlebia brevispora]|uniref:Uncharacterized protein n=1 Tax=Phlebia brevispora TaxID=194682 RepID=A0ACC1RSK6_9APHY|nr:hypothetical protein NM688_g8443 [Phlebia brevispora]
MPETLQKAFAQLEEDPTVYHTMNGPNEFYITGSLRTWSVLDTLHTITQPTLVINGRYDEAQDVCVAPFFEKIPKAKWLHFSESSHMPFSEEMDRYFLHVARFLKS